MLWTKEAWTEALFQSHNGAIAAPEAPRSETLQVAVSIPQWCDCCTERFVDWVIQSTVSIPQWCDCCIPTVSLSTTFCSGFNPTMVRLLQANHGTIGKISIKFQSHNGAIAAIPAFLNTVTLFLFQSHNGAIAASVVLLKTILRAFVSIPQWCDCCP